MTTAIHEKAVRETVVDEARSWLGTPFAAGQMCKGAGCDCGTLLLGIFSNLGLISPELINEYREVSPSFWMHSEEDRYLIRVMRHARKILESVAYRSLSIQPGCIVLLTARNGKRAHGAIVTKWPKVIHAVSPCVEEIDITQDAIWAFRAVTIFDLIENDEQDIT